MRCLLGQGRRSHRLRHHRAVSAPSIAATMTPAIVALTAMAVVCTGMPGAFIMTGGDSAKPVRPAASVAVTRTKYCLPACSMRCFCN